MSQIAAEEAEVESAMRGTEFGKMLAELYRDHLPHLEEPLSRAQCTLKDNAVDCVRALADSVIKGTPCALISKSTNKAGDTSILTMIDCHPDRMLAAFLVFEIEDNKLAKAGMVDYAVRFSMKENKEQWFDLRTLKDLTPEKFESVRTHVNNIPNINTVRQEALLLRELHHIVPLMKKLDPDFAADALEKLINEKMKKA